MDPWLKVRSKSRISRFWARISPIWAECFFVFVRRAFSRRQMDAVRETLIKVLRSLFLPSKTFIWASFFWMVAWNLAFAIDKLEIISCFEGFSFDGFDWPITDHYSKWNPIWCNSDGLLQTMLIVWFKSFISASKKLASTVHRFSWKIREMSHINDSYNISES